MQPDGGIEVEVLAFTTMKLPDRLQNSLETMKWFFLPIIRTGYWFCLSFCAVFIIADLVSFFYVCLQPAAPRYFLAVLSDGLPPPQNYEFAAVVFKYFTHRFAQFLLQYNLFLFKNLFLVWAVGAVIHFLKMLSLHFKDLNKSVSDIVEASTNKAYVLIPKLGGIFLLIGALIAIGLFIKDSGNTRLVEKALPYILWSSAGMFLLSTSFLLIHTFKEFRSHDAHTKRYILISGTAESIQLIILTSLLVTFLQHLPAETEYRLSVLINDVTSYAHGHAGEFFSSDDIRLAKVNIEKSFSSAKKVVLPLQALQPVLFNANMHITRFMILIWYVVLGTKFVALRYAHPYLYFGIGGLILSLPSLFFDQFFKHYFGQFLNTGDAPFLIALCGVAAGYYLALLLEPMAAEGSSEKG